MPANTAGLFDRALSEAGLRTKNGRGWAAAQMSAKDVAYLLVAILGALHVKDSALTIRRYGAAFPFRAVSSARLYGSTQLKELKGLPKVHSFLDAMEALVTAASGGGSLSAISSPRGPQIEITVDVKRTVADIRVFANREGNVAFVRYTRPDPWERFGRQPPAKEVRAWEAECEAADAGGLEQFRRIREAALLRVGEALSFCGEA